MSKILSAQARYLSEIIYYYKYSLFCYGNWTIQSNKLQIYTIVMYAKKIGASGMAVGFGSSSCLSFSLYLSI